LEGGPGLVGTGGDGGANESGGNADNGKSGDTGSHGRSGVVGAKGSALDPNIGGTVTAKAELSVTTASLPTAKKATPYSARLAATGGKPPDSWTAFGLPPGLSVASATGAITGKPTAAGTFKVVVFVLDSSTPARAAGGRRYTLTVAT
jgi:hypothetical protein